MRRTMNMLIVGRCTDCALRMPLREQSCQGGADSHFTTEFRFSRAPGALPELAAQAAAIGLPPGTPDRGVTEQRTSEPYPKSSSVVARLTSPRLEDDR